VLPGVTVTDWGVMVPIVKPAGGLASVIPELESATLYAPLFFTLIVQVSDPPAPAAMEDGTHETVTCTSEHENMLDTLTAIAAPLAFQAVEPEVSWNTQSWSIPELLPPQEG
jgi:hypothetical protein